MKLCDSILLISILIVTSLCLCILIVDNVLVIVYLPQIIEMANRTLTSTANNFADQVVTQIVTQLRNKI